MQLEPDFTSAGSPDTWTPIAFGKLVDEAHLTLYVLGTMKQLERARLRAILVRMRSISLSLIHI